MDINAVFREVGTFRATAEICGTPLWRAGTRLPRQRMGFRTYTGVVSADGPQRQRLTPR